MVAGSSVSCIRLVSTEHEEVEKDWMLEYQSLHIRMNVRRNWWLFYLIFGYFSTIRYLLSISSIIGNIRISDRSISGP